MFLLSSSGVKSFISSKLFWEEGPYELAHPNCSFQASSVDEVSQVRHVVDGRPRFKHIASHFCLRLICRTDEQRKKRWNMMDKGQETINKQLDVVNYLRL